VNAWLVEAARLEAASVPAFERLARELRVHRAPPTLVRRARRCMRDEVVHTRMITRLAKRRGAEVDRVSIPRHEERGVEALAIENAVEGCVNETLGAIIAEVQAKTARAASTRALFQRIARDEARHAVLAWDVLAWSMTKLDAGGSARVIRALRDAASGIDASSVAARSRDLQRELGLPDRNAAERMIVATRKLIWVGPEREARVQRHRNAADHRRG
jgi:hypothetical protein